MAKRNMAAIMAKRNMAALVLALGVMASLDAAVFFSTLEIQARRLGSWEAAMAYPRPITALSENTKHRDAK
jgi:hypothetical protein